MLNENGNLIILKLTNVNWEESEALFLLCVIESIERLNSKLTSILKILKNT